MAVLQSLGRFCHLTCQEQLGQPDTSCSNVTAHSEISLALCAEDTLVLYLVCAIFWILSIARLLAPASNQPPIPFNRFNAAKHAVLVVPLVAAFMDLFNTVHQRNSFDVASVLYVTPIFLIISFVLAGVIFYYERRVGIHSSGLMFLFWMAMVLYGAFRLLLLSIVAHESHGVTDAFRFTTFCLQFVSYLVEFILVLIPEPRVIVRSDGDRERDPCPEEGATFPSKITWWWFNGLIWKGWKKALEMSDLTDLNDEDKAKAVTAIFNKNWNEELQKANIAPEEIELSPADTPDIPGSTNNLFLDDDSDIVPLQEGVKGHNQRGYKVIAGKPAQPKKPSLVWAIAKTARNNLVVSIFFKAANDVLAFVSPLLLGAMINYTSDPTEAAWKGYFYALMLFVTAAVQSLCLHQYFHRCFVLGMQLRTVLIASVYKKALQMSSRARKDTTVGEIVNLMSVDAQRFIELMPYFHMIWSAPLQIILSIALLWVTMGPSVLAGVAAMVLLLPLNFISGYVSKKFQVTLMRTRDERIKMINEILNGIKVIKFYAWEIPFKTLVGDIRIRELGILRKIAYLTSSISIFWTCAPFIVALATFTTYALVYEDDPNNQLTAERAFVALSLFNILRFPISMLPMLIPNFIQTYVSVGRLQKFLTSDELHADRITVTDEPAKDQEESISVTGGTFTWDSPERPVLSDLNLHIRPGQLVAVVGQVGAGKSSLISALLGEVEKVEGIVTLRGRVAYVPQQAWIQNASVKDNILFGQPLNEGMYSQTIHACALQTDLDILPGGDKTEIGEKGINLSGGQKQRVSLARAVYQQADIYLMDDPLSAVDAHVGKHIFDKVIGPGGILQGKVRVLVTHGLTFLPQCDLIVVVDEGRISEMGTYSELVNNKGAFSEFIDTYANVEEDAKTPEHTPPEASPAAGETKPAPSGAADPSGPKGGGGGGAEMAPKAGDAQDKAKKGLMTKEKAEIGTVKLSVFITYLKACTYPLCLLVIVFCFLVNGMSVGTNVWLSEWSDSTSKNATQVHHVGYYLGIYAAFGLAQCLFTLFSSLSLAITSLIGAKALHNGMLDAILRAPMSFFETTPLGRILNRFAKDIQTIDETIPQTLASFLNTLLSVASTALVIMVATPMFTLVIVPLIIMYLIIQRYYVSTSRQLQRIESVSRSPIYSHFQESIQGASSIRAYRVQGKFVAQNEQKVDYSQLAYYPTICSNRWLAIRLEFLGNLVILFAALFAAIQRNYGEQLNLEITPGLVGLSISYALQVTQSLNWFVRMTSQLESNIVAVERTKEYSEARNIGTEAPAIIPSRRPPDGWPTAGEVKFEGYSTRYREGMDLVLKDITVMMEGNKKIGIVGRTGAGKSSMTLSLFRIIEAVQGFIQIDGVNIADIGLQDLRSRITIIPQDPVLFSGTLRLNLDPFNTYSDEDLWRVLEIANLRDFVSTLSEGLAYPVSEGGENLSVGQRQLVCLARALLRKTKILVLDEATAAVDMETDDLIQKTIRSEFATCTVFTIAHRLNTIMDYDYVMVLGAGRVLEYAPPAELLANSSSVFYSMARDAGLVASKDASLVLSENASEDPGLVTSKDAGLVTSKDAGLVTSKDAGIVP